MFKNVQKISILIFTMCLLISANKNTPILKCQLSNNKQSVNCGSVQGDSFKTCEEKLTYKREEFTINICLKKEGSQYAVGLNLQNVNTFDTYQLKVNQNYIDQNAQMSYFYANPSQLYYSLKDEQSIINANSNAQIQIKFKFFKMMRVLRLIPSKLNLDKIDIIIKRLVSVESKQKQIIENEEKLKLSLVEVRKQLEMERKITIKIKEQSNKEIMSLKHNISQLYQRMDILRKEKDAQIAQLKKQTLVINSKIDKQGKSSEQQSRQTKEIKQYLQKDLLQLIMFNNNNFNNFIAKKINKNVLLKYKTINRWYGFLTSYPIQVGKKTKLQVNQTMASNFQIFYGVSTDKTIGMSDPYNHLECISYHAKNGHVYQNGRARAGGAIIYNGIVTIIADLINWKISWEVDGNKLAETNISAAMRTSKLYFIISMFYQNDEVEILNYWDK